MSFVFLKKSKCCKIKNKYFFEKIFIYTKTVANKGFQENKKKQTKNELFYKYIVIPYERERQ